MNARSRSDTEVRESSPCLQPLIAEGLLATDGPVIIDLPQPVDAAGNNHAPRMLIRDVNKLRNFFGQYAPDLLSTRYGAEIWALHASGVLVPGMPLTGRYEPQSGAVDLSGVLREIEDARIEEAAPLNTGDWAGARIPRPMSLCSTLYHQI